MNLSDYVLLPRSQRLKHIDLSSPCLYGERKKPRIKLFEYLGVVDDKTGRINHCCHLCTSSSTKEKVCVNPLHLYFGTASENMNDKPPEQRSNAVKLGHSNVLEERSSRGKKAWEGKSEEERSSVALETWEKRNPDERFNIVSKGWVTRRKNGNSSQAGKKTASQIWESTVDGFRSSAGNVARHNKSKGWDPDARTRIA